MSCDGAQALNPFCQASKFLTDQAVGVADDAFSRIAGYFGLAAQQATVWLWEQIDDATTIDLGSPNMLTELRVTAAIAAVLCLGLFLVQVITGVLRREPGALGRSVTGLLISFVASAFALTSSKLLLGAVDSLSAGVVQYTMGTNIPGLGSKLALGHVASLQNPAVALLFSLLILGAVVMVWAAMMIRKMMILIAAVLAPLAFAGATADITRGWVRRWIEFVAAMIVSKLLLVIMFSVGVAVLNGAGQVGDGATQVGTQLAMGSLILLMGGFAPWVAIKMFHFAGDALYAAHGTAGQSAAGARTVIAAPQKAAMMHWQGRQLASTAAALGGRGSHASVANPPAERDSAQDGAGDQARASADPRARAGVTTSPRGNPPGSGTGGSQGVSAVGTGGTSSSVTAGGAGAGTAGSATAAAPAAGPAAAAIAPAVVAGAAVATATAAGKATGAAAQNAAPEQPTTPAHKAGPPTPAIREWPDRHRPRETS